jgi:HEPN domain-containing protein
MDKLTEQWFTQADYDLDTAEYMLKGERYFYAVFMVHLAVEKALKGLWQARLQAMPPKTHNLLYLMEKIGVQAPAGVDQFLTTLNDVSVPTRYPDDLQKILADYSEVAVREILAKSREVLSWIKAQR